jgi:hypothetical protein
MAKKLDLEILQGDTFTRLVRWETPPFIYKPITGATQAAPVSITAIAHGVKNGWRVAVVSVKGMKALNASHGGTRDSDYHQATIPDVDHVTLNKVNSADYDPYTSGGYLQYYTPVDMTSYTARMTIKDKIGGTILIALVSPTDIVLDNTNHTITITIGAAVTAAFAWTKGTYDLELVSPTGVVTKLFKGNVTIKKEATT